VIAAVVFDLGGVLLDAEKSRSAITSATETT